MESPQAKVSCACGCRVGVEVAIGRSTVGMDLTLLGPSLCRGDLGGMYLIESSCEKRTDLEATPGVKLRSAGIRMPRGVRGVETCSLARAASVKTYQLSRSKFEQRRSTFLKRVTNAVYMYIHIHF